jgi:hypothetical protein
MQNLFERKKYNQILSSIILPLNHDNHFEQNDDK